MKQLFGAMVVVVLVVGGFWIARRSGQEEEVMPEINLEPSNQMVEELPEPMSEVEKQEIEDKFAKQGVEMTVLKDVAQGQAVGTAWRHFAEGEFVHKVDASGLKPLEKGYFYEGWLVGKDGFFSTGRLPEAEGKGSLYYSAEGDKSDFEGVVVTLEAEDGDEAPDKHVLEGSF